MNPPKNFLYTNRFQSLRLMFCAEAWHSRCSSSPRSTEKGTDSACGQSQLSMPLREMENHNNENLFDLFARQCARCHWHLHAGSCPAEQLGGSDTREDKGQDCQTGNWGEGQSNRDSKRWNEEKGLHRVGCKR